MQSNLDEQIVTLESEDGRAYQCRILGVFDFDGKEYAMLLNIGDGEEAENQDEPNTVIMQLIEQDEQAIFRTIESDEEFERVVAHIKTLAKEMTEEDDDEE